MSNQLTPKQQYEERKAARQKLADMDLQVKQKTETILLLDMLDRFVTAVEIIADKLSQPSTGAPCCGGHSPSRNRHTSGRRLILGKR